MNRKNSALVAVLFAVALSLGFYSKQESTESSPEAATPPERREVVSEENMAKEVDMGQKQESRDKPSPTSITPRELNSLHESFPGQKKVDAESKANPHGPSEQLMTFAQKMGPLMEKAFKNENDANILVKELADCAMDESVANSARALCVTNTERLSKVHPQMEKAAMDLRSQVSPEVQKILETNDRIIKKE